MLLTRAKKEWGRQTGDRELGTGNWGQQTGQGTGGRELGQGTWAGNWGQQTGDRERGTGFWGQQTGQGTGGRELGTTLRRRERVLLLAQVKPWTRGGRMLDERVGL